MRPSPFAPQPARQPGLRRSWGHLYGASYSLAISTAAHAHDGLVLLITADTPAAARLEDEIRFFIGDDEALPILHFPDWETLPYDRFSPHQDIISARIEVLYRLPRIQRGILIVPVATLMQRLPPREYIGGNTLLLDVGDPVDLEAMRKHLERSGYRCVSQVVEHGEFAVRGSLLDLFPMGSRHPYRIELFDNEVETIRTFDPENQRSINKVEHIRLLPAREFSLDERTIRYFRERYRIAFEGDPQRSLIYRNVSDGITPAGIEYYLPLFFEHTATLFDYLPATTLLLAGEEVDKGAETFQREYTERFETLRLDIEHPPLAPSHLYLDLPDLYSNLKRYGRTDIQHFELADTRHGENYDTLPPPNVTFNVHAEQPTEALRHFVKGFTGRILFCAESPGRRETLLEMLRGCDIHPKLYAGWSDFITGTEPICITIGPLEQGLLLGDPPLALLTETQLYGEQVLQRRRRSVRGRDADAIIRNLAELQIGAPVVHEEHGVGRYLGLQALTADGLDAEFLALEYAGGDKLYVPVASLHLISRYTGASPEQTPLHKLGSGQWEKARRKASQKAGDAAAELLEIYAKREARQGHSYPFNDHAYSTFAASFAFEATPDQQDAIDAVIADMRSHRPMDRLICGDVGFGKTEVAMRAAFIAALSGKQVAMLVPTTLLVEQHLQNFRDRFADWPVRIEALSRFRSKKEQGIIVGGLDEGLIDIVVGTHKLLQEGIKFKRLGLVVIDEEHRFGVKQKERFKALRAAVDVLTLTATPIPRTLNMALGGIRDLSIIATPPARRLAVKTLVNQWDGGLIREACLREIKRGGQVFFLHNAVETIEGIARKLEDLIPEVHVKIAHGQMRERELEHVMSDFYHQRFNMLICTTIIETGIDIPTANTIIINRADRFGLAQLYQLRGRVGRSHHRAYAYLIVPPRSNMTRDAIARLEAVESIEELGTGFSIATHDLEIRGAGELLGEEQSGQIHEVGFSLYMDLLERAVKALKKGKEPDLERPLIYGAEVSLGVAALIPADYLPDIHERLILYKRIASADSGEALRELQVEMIDRFGLLPEATRDLFRIAELKLRATPLDIIKIELGEMGGHIIFGEQPKIDPLKIVSLIQTRAKTYKLDGDKRLRIMEQLPDINARIGLVETLLDTLHP